MSASALGPVGATSSYTLSIASAYHCRQRAAPGISTFRLSEMGFPMSSVSRSASSSVCARMASAKRSRIFLRFAGAVCDQTPLRNAARAAATARLMSSSSPAATRARSLPVPGLMVSKVAPEAASRRSETSGLPSSTSSSIPKKAWGVALRSSVKNSASDIGTPSSTFLSELTEGLTRFCSMREMSPLVTPARRASSRCETPKVVRTLRSRAPTSMVMVFRILDKSREIVPPVAPFVHFIYHSQFQGQKPLLPPKPHRAAHVQRHRPHEPIRTRSVLDALHRQPSVQGEAATAREGERHALLDARGAADPRCGGGTVVRERRSRPAGDRPGGREPARDHGVRAALPDGTPGRVRAGQRAREDLAGALEARVLHQLRLRIGRYGAEDRPRLAPRSRGSLAHPPDRARARLSRRGLRRHLGRRHGLEPQGLVGIAPPGRRSPAAHARSGKERLLARRSGTRRRAGG